jgi:N-methylhydantoinase A/oxoprolinase/acetone carboxylase beta subunit
MGYRIGIDVGGTNTDAVIVDDDLKIKTSVKTATTSDVTTGIYTAKHAVLEDTAIDKKQIRYAMLGTTHSTNAIVQRQRLLKVGLLRLGKPAGMAVEPMIDWPKDLIEAVSENTYSIEGGHEFDGREINPLNEQEILSACREMKDKVQAVAIVSIFSPVSPDHEKRTKEIVRQELGNIPVTMSYEIASIGFLERENATILNAALHEVAKITALGFTEGLAKEGVTDAEVYLCQNDGTLMSVDYAINYPILTIACGPTNSIRGASYLSGLRDAIVLDVGGTTSDIGVIVKSFPRESSLAVNIGGVRTNFRMPDLISIGLGGGSIVRDTNGDITIGPDSVGYQLTEKALVFGGQTVTVTDIVVRLGLADIGNKSNTDHIEETFAKKALVKIMAMINKDVDKMKLSKEPIPLVLVGGGSIAVTDEIDGVSEIIRPQNHGVANAVGAAIAQVSDQIEKVYSLEKLSRDNAMADAKKTAVDEAIKAGADPATIEIVDVEDVPLAYLPGNATRIKVKAAGDLKKG